MESFIIDVPVPSMGATVSELNVIVIKVKVGDHVAKGQRLGDLESDKSAFEFESPAEGTIRALQAKPGATMNSGDTFCQIETTDSTLRHLESKASAASHAPVPVASAAPAPVPAKPAAPVIWTPRATKLAQEAGLDPAKITDIEATGPGNRVSGDDVQRYLVQKKS